MQTCPDTIELVGIPPAPAGPPTALATSLAFDLGERTGMDRRKPAPRRDAQTIAADLENQYRADLERLNRRYAGKLSSAVARIKPVSERRKEALDKMDELRAVVRRTNPVMSETGIDDLILRAVVETYGDLADANMKAEA